MGFFDQAIEQRLQNIADDADDADDDIEEFAGPTETMYLGGVVPVELLVAQSDTAAVAIRNLVAYPDGFKFTLDLWVRKPVRRRHASWRFSGPIQLDLDETEDGGKLPDEFVRFGIEFPDGARVSNIDETHWELSPDATEPFHGLETGGGGGSDSHYEQTWWAWPIPSADGVLAFVCEWPSYGIDESRVELPSSLVSEAAARARPVWPDTPAGPSHLTRGHMAQWFDTRNSD